MSIKTVKYWYLYESFGEPQVAELDEKGRFAIPPGRAVVFQIQTPLLRGLATRKKYRNDDGSNAVLVQVPEECLIVELGC